MSKDVYTYITVLLTTYMYMWYDDVRRSWTVVRQTGSTWVRTCMCWLLLRTARTELMPSYSELSTRWRNCSCQWWVCLISSSSHHHLFAENSMPSRTMRIGQTVRRQQKLH